MIRSPRQKKEERKALRMLFLVSQIGICMMVPVFFCVFLGQWLSEKTGLPLLFPLVLLVGILAGFRSCWQVIGRFTGLGRSAGTRQEPAHDVVVSRQALEGMSEKNDSGPVDKRDIKDDSGPVDKRDIKDEWDELDRPDRPVF